MWEGPHISSQVFYFSQTYKSSSHYFFYKSFIFKTLQILEPNKLLEDQLPYLRSLLSLKTFMMKFITTFETSFGQLILKQFVLYIHIQSCLSLLTSWCSFAEFKNASNPRVTAISGYFVGLFHWFSYSPATDESLLLRFCALKDLFCDLWIIYLHANHCLSTIILVNIFSHSTTASSPFMSS